MTAYDFKLTFALPDADADADAAAYLDALFEAGCDDATVGIGKPGSLGLAFTREAESAENALKSAIEAVKKAVPGAELIEVTPDLVNLSDLAQMVGCTRQNIRKYAIGEVRSAKARFPAPAFASPQTVWHFYNIACWLNKYTDLHPPREVIETSRVAYALNLERQNKLLEAN